MKKLLILFILIFAILLTSCNLGDNGNIPSGDSGNNSSDGSDNTAPDSDPYDPIGDSCRHSDSDGNKKCDLCDKNTEATVDFLAVNDLHGKIFDSDTHIGVDELTTYIKNLKSANPNFVLLSSGDMWQGSYESNMTKGIMMTDWMNAAGFHSMTVGNHEYDWGAEYIKENEKAAHFPILGINIFDKETNQRVSYCQASAVVECDGFEVGIIGAVGNCYSSISPEKCSEVTFKVGSALTNLIKDESTKLRNAGVDIIILSIHDGNSGSSNGVSEIPYLSYYDSELSDGYVDAVFEAHTHQNYVIKDAHGVYHLQGGGDNSAISRLSASYDLISGDFTVNLATTVSANSYAGLADDPIVNTLKEKYKDVVAAGENPVADIPSYMNSNIIEDLAAYVYLKAGLEKWGGSYNVFLGGGFIKAREPYDLEAGEVYYKDIYGILPFDNDLVLASIKGSDLITRFINNSHADYHLAYSAYGEANKNSVDKNATYYIITDTYSLYYAANKLSAVEFYDAGVYARDLLSDYLKEIYPPADVPFDDPENPGNGDSGSSQPEVQKNALIILIDASGSMLGYETLDNLLGAEGSKLYYAKLGAKEALGHMSEYDYIGIYSLSDGMESQILPLTPTVQKDRILSAIESIEGGGGTVFSSALMHAGDELNSLSDDYKKHIAIITDGEPDELDMDRTRYALIKNAEAGITASIIGIECTRDAINSMKNILTEYAGCFEDDFYDVTPGYAIANSVRNMLAKLSLDNTESNPYFDEIITVDDALGIGESLAAGERTDEYYYVIGTVKSITNTEYGNMYITDGKGNEIYIYGLYSLSGGKFNTFAKAPSVGDTVIIKSQIFHYKHASDSSKNKLELEHAYLVSFSASVTVAGACDIGEALTINTSTQEQYIITATVTQIDNDFYGNLYVTDSTGETIYVYGIWDKTGAYRFSDFKDKISKGDTIVLISAIKHYQNESGTYTVVALENAVLLGKIN